jgi:hypothetical protein
MLRRAAISAASARRPDLSADKNSKGRGSKSSGLFHAN